MPVVALRSKLVHIGEELRQVCVPERSAIEYSNPDEHGIGGEHHVVQRENPKCSADSEGSD
jgi:hypothetical protein